MNLSQSNLKQAFAAALGLFVGMHSADAQNSRTSPSSPESKIFFTEKWKDLAFVSCVSRAVQFDGSVIDSSRSSTSFSVIADNETTNGMRYRRQVIFSPNGDIEISVFKPGVGRGSVNGMFKVIRKFGDGKNTIDTSLSGGIFYTQMFPLAQPTENLMNRLNSCYYNEASPS